MLHLTLNVLLYILNVHGLENLALHKPTWEQYPWPNKSRDFGSENAVDGMYDDRGTGGQCTISDDGKYNATWRVDLGGVVSISYIDIYYRTENQADSENIAKMAGFFIYVSNTSSKNDGYPCYHDESLDPKMVSLDQHISCTLLRRYVIYYNERKPGVEYLRWYSKYAYDDLCEVEVYRCNGAFGDDCIYPCPKNCQDRRCDTISGHCPSCVSGYMGLKCNQVCNNNSYGPACAITCGNCSNRDTCHHITGICLHGCAEGTIGGTCQEGCQAGNYGNCSHCCSENCIETSQCDRFTGRCDGGCKPGWTGNTCNQIRATDIQPSSCTESYNIVIIVVSVLIVATGSLINFVIWKRNAEKLSRIRKRIIINIQNLKRLTNPRHMKKSIVIPTETGSYLTFWERFSTKS